MKFNVHYFGLLAERRGLAQEEITSAAMTTAELYEELDLRHELGLSIQHFRVAVNDEFVAWDHVLQDYDSVALLPPMSGG